MRLEVVVGAVGIVVFAIVFAGGLILFRTMGEQQGARGRAQRGPGAPPAPA